ncbi:MAG TPA: hypothetical protein VK335_04010 [Bryobacteraceae bacterium]|nr:hypothetical protein [Bryobacteraceae bacterium]
MATANLISLTSALLGAGTGEVIKNGIQVLAERVKSAQDTYQLTLGQSDDPVQNLRHDVIHKINELRNRAALCISDPDFQQKVWCLLMEQMADAYETNTERGLNLVQYSAGQIEDVLNSYEQANKYRRKARWVGVFVSLISLAGIGYFLRFADTTNLNGNTAPPVLGVPWCVLFWSFVGSFAAILYRFTNAGDQELEDPLRWLFSRPLTGVVMGSITYLVIEAGFLTLGSDPGGAATLGKNDVMLLVAFLAGFSDRFADSLLQSLVGRFGGEKNGELVAMRMGLRQPSGSILDHLTGVVNRGKNTPVPAPSPNMDGGGKAATLAMVEKSERGVAAIAQ